MYQYVLVQTRFIQKTLFLYNRSGFQMNYNIVVFDYDIGIYRYGLRYPEAPAQAHLAELDGADSWLARGLWSRTCVTLYSRPGTSPFTLVQLVTPYAVMLLLAARYRVK